MKHGVSSCPNLHFVRRSTLAFLRFSLAHFSSSKPSLEESVRSAVESNSYQQSPELLDASKEFGRNPNPFAFLSKFTENHRVHVVHGILQSLICVRPRGRLYGVYSFVLSYALGSSNPLPLAMVIAIRAMRANKDIWRSVEMLEFLEGEVVYIGFEAYESVLEGCLEGRHFVLAGKFVTRMTERGFIPYIKERQQRVFEGLGEAASLIIFA